jgi:hypothetical protein
MSSWNIAKVDLAIERQITTAAIVSTDFLKEIVPQWNPIYLQSDFCRTVTRWCVEYYNMYKEAPNTHIQDIYLSYRLRKELEPEVSKLIADFLSDLSERFIEEGSDFNYRFILDKTFEYFTMRALLLLADTIETSVKSGAMLEAEVAISAYKRPVTLGTPCIDVMTNKELIMSALAEDDDDDDEILFQLPGDFGRLVGPLCRDDFIAVAGPMGRGKSWALQYIATEALLANLNVAFFSMGDMTLKQMTRRFYKSFTGLPTKPGTYPFPIFDCAKNISGQCTFPERRGTGRLTQTSDGALTVIPSWVPCTVCRESKRDKYFMAVITEMVELKQPLTWQRAVKRATSISRMVTGKLRLDTWPRKSAGIAEVDGTLKLMSNMDGFIPDVVITDYADIMKDTSGSKEYRHQLNALWEAHDSLAKDYHCLVVSATQTDRSTYGGKDVGGENVAEDIRKLAHVSTMFSLNQKLQEKRDKVMRVKVIKSRHEESDPEKQCFLLQQLDCGQFCIDSYTPLFSYQSK